MIGDFFQYGFVRFVDDFVFVDGFYVGEFVYGVGSEYFVCCVKFSQGQVVFFGGDVFSFIQFQDGSLCDVRQVIIGKRSQDNIFVDVEYIYVVGFGNVFFVIQYQAGIGICVVSFDFSQNIVEQIIVMNFVVEVYW